MLATQVGQSTSRGTSNVQNYLGCCRRWCCLFATCGTTEIARLFEGGESSPVKRRFWFVSRLLIGVGGSLGDQDERLLLARQVPGQQPGGLENFSLELGELRKGSCAFIGGHIWEGEMWQNIMWPIKKNPHTEKEKWLS